MTGVGIYLFFWLENALTAYVGHNAAEFSSKPSAEIEQNLIRSDSVSGFSQVSHEQIRAWRIEIEILKQFADWAKLNSSELGTCGIVLEYRIPRREKRIDAIILFRSTVVVIEFKVGAHQVTQDGIDQLTDYALDLAYYHAESQGRRIVPVLCPTELSQSKTLEVGGNTPISNIVCVGRSDIVEVLADLLRSDTTECVVPINHEVWTASPYRPVPGIIDATVQLFAKHEVSDISTALAESQTILATIGCVNEVIRDARDNRRKVLCLLTGVPGAGKTLTGLQIVHSQELVTSDWGTVFLSGNGPLLFVLKAALARDYKQRQKCTQVQARNHAGSLLHSVHSYLAESFKAVVPPTEHVVIFDEAQRAWDASKMTKMAGRQRRMSGEEITEVKGAAIGAEPMQILTVLDRHAEGAVIVALCGNGQEIHDGEAGVSEWVKARDHFFPGWHLSCSPVAAELADISANQNNTVVDPRLHLSVPLRSHRAVDHAIWVDSVLSGDHKRAYNHVNQTEFPIVVTRDLDEARTWLRTNTLGSRRMGLLASSGATRLRPYGIEVSSDFRKGIDFAEWFTAPRTDHRSSHALEVAATEFECQGLELDRTCVCWCWDLLATSKGMQPQKSFGANWRSARAGRETEYSFNKYRVLLTRAREGMVIWVPRGDEHDKTRRVSEADHIAEFLLACGAQEI